AGATARTHPRKGVADVREWRRWLVGVVGDAAVDQNIVVPARSPAPAPVAAGHGVADLVAGGVEAERVDYIEIELQRVSDQPPQRTDWYVERLSGRNSGGSCHAPEPGVGPPLTNFHVTPGRMNW